jgi:hypothetical protein
MNKIGEEIVTIALAIIGLAIIAVLVSKKANTTSVIQAAASGLGNNIAVASAPVTGISMSPSLGYPSDNSLAYGFGQ